MYLANCAESMRLASRTEHEEGTSSRVSAIAVFWSTDDLRLFKLTKQAEAGSSGELLERTWL